MTDIGKHGDYTTDTGQTIPCLLSTASSAWPPDLVDALKRELDLTPDACKRLRSNSKKRAAFDELVRRWSTFADKRTVEDVTLHSGIMELMCGG